MLHKRRGRLFSGGPEKKARLPARHILFQRGAGDRDPHAGHLVQRVLRAAAGGQQLREGAVQFQAHLDGEGVLSDDERRGCGRGCDVLELAHTCTCVCTCPCDFMCGVPAALCHICLFTRVCPCECVVSCVCVRVHVDALFPRAATDLPHMHAGGGGTPALGKAVGTIQDHHLPSPAQQMGMQWGIERPLNPLLPFQDIMYMLNYQYMLLCFKIQYHI